MKTVEIVRQKDRIDALFGKATQITEDTELVSHLSRYICILAAGFLETSLITLLVRFSEKRADPKIVRCVSVRIRKFSNAKMAKISDLINEFDVALKNELDAYVAGEYKSAVDSIVSNRHQIAHGKDVSISISVLKDYWKAAVKVVEFLDDRLGD